MGKNQTVETAASVVNFINAHVTDEQKKADCFSLMEMMSEWSGFEPKMWGPAIIGFGSYHYQYKSGHAGDAPLLAFSPRKAAISLYAYSPVGDQNHLLERLGKYRMGKACLYIKKLSDIDKSVLAEISRATIAYLNEHHECACRA